MSRKLRVFLCHASQDKPAVRKLHRYLKQRGVQPWLDELDLLPGENWEVEIPNALFASDVILVCLSKNSVDKEGYVQKEITFALDKAQEKPEGTIFIIPVKLEVCDVPRRLNRYQWVDLFRQDGYKRLLLGLNKRALGLGSDVSLVLMADDTTPKPVSKVVAAHPEPEKVEPKKVGQEVNIKPEREAALSSSSPISSLPRKEAKPQGSVAKPAPLFPLLVGEDRVRAKPAPKFDFRLLGIGGIVLLVLFFGGLGLNYLIQRLPVAIAAVTLPENTATFELPTLTDVPFTSTPQPTETPIPTPALGVGLSMVSPNDGMKLLYVPAGNFLMGSTYADTLADSDEKPQHTVYLDAFWIDQTDVTNAMYAKCVLAGKCDLPSYTNPYRNSSYANYPVVYVDWNKAKTYCEWADRQLPSEAQWEKAARGTDGRIYPWGNTAPDNTLLNYNQNVGDTTEVGKYPKGASMYGALDMAGNVWQWVNDWYQSGYYNTLGNNVSNPLGPSSSDGRVLRGGSWYFSNSDVRSANRYGYVPTYASDVIGFRCSRSQP